MALTIGRQRLVSKLCRCFSTSSIQSNSIGLLNNKPEDVADKVPAYPYGPARLYKQSNYGLYGGKRIRFGNNVGEKIAVKSRRSFDLNIFRKRIYSRALRRQVQLKVSSRVLRTIDKVGGLDEYLLGEKEGRIKELGTSGWWLRWAIMQTPTVRERFSLQRHSLGLSDPKPTPDQLQHLSEALSLNNAETRKVVEELEQAGVDLKTSAETTKEPESAASRPVKTTRRQRKSQSHSRVAPTKQDTTPSTLKFRVGPGKFVALKSDDWHSLSPKTLRRGARHSTMSL